MDPSLTTLDFIVKIFSSAVDHGISCRLKYWAEIRQYSGTIPVKTTLKLRLVQN